MKNNKSFSKMLPILLFILIIIAMFNYVARDNSKDISNSNNKNETKIAETTDDTNELNLISSQENKNIEEIIKEHAKKQGYNVNIEYAGTLDIIQMLNSGKKFDGVWLSNSIWGYMLDDVKLSNSKCTSINPVVFAIKKSKAKELGFIGKEIYTKDIVKAISDGKLKFSMSNPTVTNSGASAYLGFLSTLAGNPEVLTSSDINNEELKAKIKTLFSGMEKSSGDEDYLETSFINGNYEAVVSYESSIIDINKELEKQGKETLYAIYPIDGVSVSDSPLAYIDNKNENKKNMFEDLQSYILSNEGQKLLQEKGKRTWYGGINANADKTIFNPEWGIDTTKYISPIKYPSTTVIKEALNLYQNELRKPVHIVFCLDYSGSMNGSGIEQLRKAMKYVLTSEASDNFIQFSEKDKIDVVAFENDADTVWSATNGLQTQGLLNLINSKSPTGATALFPACEKALDLLKNEDESKYNLSVVLMTDGMGNIGSMESLEQKYKEINKQIPIYSITFGFANEKQLDNIASFSNAKVFDGTEDLVKAFKEVRGYN